ncbi:RMD1 family protein [Nodosilinea sp. PGN35]|uniref:RMD1 family protein n=1 Tax=Nodosilinea sp. PGN35 TaxID=3020489 RepID=UPI0023B2D13A|nr:RMD1 family protein [Nodosilinea sp. TSF1-S3]MDF0365283.1 RMD1 family protein [Nodosilinea sp. TSF1-S3]
MTTATPGTAIAAFALTDDVAVCAYFLGQSIDLGALTPSSGAALPPSSPLMVPVGEGGQGVLFSYGAVVLFGLSEAAEQAFIASLRPYIDHPIDHPETEAATIRLTPDSSGKVQDGLIFLSSLDGLRLHLVADVMAKSVVLAYYEIGAAAVFDRIEPYAVELQHQHRPRVQGDQLLQQIGQTLMIQHKIVGRVEIVDKPELLWEYPELDPLYHRLEDEYEIRDRHSALERKLDLVSRTAETVIDLQRHQTGLRLEWYVVLLIVIEVLLSLYDLFVRPR